ncbi:hypothetical protein BaRGS_00018477 [Batillaria attramentaria]|uniref:Immunoglobulin subtype domain-containing protein n=1 Tax=Batillaria attramentaria TaxID=370345 RepID=A0ABD0KST3_9CAEN
MAIYVGSRCCLLLLILIFPDGLCTKTICSPDAVIRGEQAKIICSFDKNLSRRDQAILVMKQDDVRVGNYSCHSSPGYLCDSSISSTLTLTVQIPSVTHNNAGSYACHTIPPLLGDQAACSLTVQAESSVREVGSSNKFIVQSAGKICVFYAAFCIMRAHEVRSLKKQNYDDHKK